MNTTTLPQESAASLDSPGYMAYAILLIVIIIVAGMMIGIVVVALAMAHSIPRPLRLFLINLLLAGLVMAVSLGFNVFTSAVLVAVGPEHPRPPLYLCRVCFWLFAGGAVTRFWSLAAFSLSVLAVVRFGKKTIHLCYATFIMTVLWIVPMAMNLYILFPYVYEAHYVDGVACFTDNNNITLIEVHYIFATNWAISGGIIPLTVSITVPIVCLCYTKNNAITEDAWFRKGLAKFSLFLVLGGVIGITGGAVPAAVSFYSEAPGVCLSFGFAAVSLFPTPIIIIAYMKAVQEQIKKMFTCGRLTKAAKDSKSTPGGNKAAAT